MLCSLLSQKIWGKNTVLNSLAKDTFSEKEVFLLLLEKDIIATNYYKDFVSAKILRIFYSLLNYNKDYWWNCDSFHLSIKEIVPSMLFILIILFNWKNLEISS